MRRTPSLALSALLFTATLGLGCGPDATSSGGGGLGKRISRQELTDAARTVTQYWLYTYDASGVSTEVRGYSGAGALQTRSSYTYAAGLRTQTTNHDASDAVTGWTTYEYTGGVLSRSTVYTAAGAVNGYATHVFDQGKKVATSRYSATDVYLGRIAFAYDPVTGLRTGATSYDASDVVTSTTTRTYVDGLLDEASFNGGASFRTFTWENGPRTIDLEPFFDF